LYCSIAKYSGNHRGRGDQRILGGDKSGKRNVANGLQVKLVEENGGNSTRQLDGQE